MRKCVNIQRCIYGCSYIAIFKKTEHIGLNSRRLKC